MICEKVHAALSEFDVCSESEEGARVVTHCLYPSFDTVNVFVARLGDGFRVHDGAGAARAAWMHGRDETVIKRALARESAKHALKVEEGTLVADVASGDWLRAAILAVANASSAAANRAVEHFVAAAENTLRTKILDTLKHTVPPKTITIEAPYVGRSGRTYRFDFAVRSDSDRIILIDAVSPHHISVASKYVAFADTRADAAGKFAVHDRPLEPSDASLMQQVADLVPLGSLEEGTLRVLSRAKAP
jgi:hypothetical protein